MEEGQWTGQIEQPLAEAHLEEERDHTLGSGCKVKYVPGDSTMRLDIRPFP
jgi:hypothetical protein